MWTAIPVPQHKKDWPGQMLHLSEPFPQGGVPAAMVRIERRKNAMDTIHTRHDVSCWGSMRILEVFWRCLHCGASRSGYLPEWLIEEGVATFIAEV